MPKNLKIKKAFKDISGWILFGEGELLIEFWPEDWPKEIDLKFLADRKIEIG